MDTFEIDSAHSFGCLKKHAEYFAYIRHEKSFNLNQNFMFSQSFYSSLLN
jgi:hypothetical protein